MNDAASICYIVVLYLRGKYVPKGLDGMVIVDRTALKHEFIDKVIMIFRRQEIKHPKCHKNKPNHDTATKP